MIIEAIPCNVDTKQNDISIEVSNVLTRSLYKLLWRTYEWEFGEFACSSRTACMVLLYVMVL